MRTSTDVAEPQDTLAELIERGFEALPIPTLALEGTLLVRGSFRMLTLRDYEDTALCEERVTWDQELHHYTSGQLSYVAWYVDQLTLYAQPRPLDRAGIARCKATLRWRYTDERN